ncbi:MAG: phosphoribosyltransferase family protein [Robiginitalea sp.]
MGRSENIEIKQTKLNLSKILNDALTYIVPELCFGCNAVLYRGEHLLCAFCRNELPLTDFNFRVENPADRLFYGRCRVEKVSAMLYYAENGIVRNLIHHLKYRKQEKIGAWLGDWFGQQIQGESSLHGISIVLPVPLHPKKKRKRGYNQCSRFGSTIAGHLGAVYSEKHLIKTTRTRTQTTKNRWKRWKNTEEAFRLRHPWEFEGRDILIVDDVLTTGATLEACVHAFNSVRDKRLFIAVMTVVP